MYGNRPIKNCLSRTSSLFSVGWLARATTVRGEIEMIIEFIAISRSKTSYVYNMRHSSVVLRGEEDKTEWHFQEGKMSKNTHVKP
jgi:hypothetical protein